jgi:hypothetical protein
MSRLEGILQRHSALPAHAAAKCGQQRADSEPATTPLAASPRRADIQTGILTLSLLKRSRRGNYANATTNADTFWRCLFDGKYLTHVHAMALPVML